MTCTGDPGSSDSGIILFHGSLVVIWLLESHTHDVHRKCPNSSPACCLRSAAKLDAKITRIVIGFRPHAEPSAVALHPDLDSSRINRAHSRPVVRCTWRMLRQIKLTVSRTENKQQIYGMQVKCRLADIGRPTLFRIWLEEPDEKNTSLRCKQAEQHSARQSS